MQIKQEPLVSIAIPCYNHALYVIESINSVINQSYTNIELIIIDDGSSDDSVIIINEIIEKCKKRFVRFEFRSRPNIGLSATLNEAIEWCEGKYYSAIASDDIMINDKTSLQVDFLEDNLDYVAVFGGIGVIDYNGNSAYELLGKSRSYSFDQIIMHKHNLPTPTQMVRLNTIRKVGGYDSNLYIEDWYMWLKLSELGEIYYIDKIFCLYRIHESNMSKNLIKMQQARLDVLEHFKEYKKYNKAVKNTKWVNKFESYAKDKSLNFFLLLYFKNPLRMSKAIFKFMNNKMSNKK